MMETHIEEQGEANDLMGETLSITEWTCEQKLAKDAREVYSSRRWNTDKTRISRRELALSAPAAVRQERALALGVLSNCSLLEVVVSL